MLGHDRSEHGRHVLRDQHRNAVAHGGELRDQGSQRLRASGRGADQEHARGNDGEPTQRDRLRCGRQRTQSWTGDRSRGRDPGLAAAPPAAAAELHDLFDQLASERDRSSDAAVGLRLGNIIGCAQRERLQADFGVPARQCRGHDDHEIAPLLEQQREGGDAVELRHIDVEHDDVRVGALQLIDRLPAGAQRSDDTQPGLLGDPAREQAADHDGVVDDHDAERSPVRRRQCWRGMKRETHRTGTRDTATPAEFKSVRLPGISPRRSLCRTVS